MVQKKWDVFREKREMITDQYAALRKKQSFSETFIKYIVLRQFFEYLSNNFMIAYIKKEKQMKAVYMTLKIKQIWKRRVRKMQSKTLPEAHQKSRYFLTFFGQSMKMSARARAMKHLKMFLKQQIYRERMKIICRNFYERVRFMQKRMKNSLIIRQAKVDVLMFHWE